MFLTSPVQMTESKFLIILQFMGMPLGATLTVVILSNCFPGSYGDLGDHYALFLCVHDICHDDFFDYGNHEFVGFGVFGVVVDFAGGFDCGGVVDRG